jgi:hypothetical protein
MPFVRDPIAGCLGDVEVPNVIVDRAWVTDAEAVGSSSCRWFVRWFGGQPFEDRDRLPDQRRGFG